jgi:5-oxoprolinase (ATP-hydrolysing) subunit A
MVRHVDLNCDLGESFGPWRMGDDGAMLSLVTSANVACGFHAGDPDTMFETAVLAKAKGVAIGAHPGFADLAGFGRRVILGDSLAQIERMVAYQIGALQAVAGLAGHRITHVKPHGALSNRANDDLDLARAIGRAITGVDRSLIYVTMPGRPTEAAALELNLPLVREVFADRTYEDDGALTSRQTPGSVIHDAKAASARVLRMLDDQAVTTTGGRRLPVRIDTICVHGDTPTAVAMARAIRAGLEAAGVTLRPFAG